MLPRPKNYPRRDPNRCPTHPGAVLREIVFPELRVSKTAIANAMKISRNQLYLILGERQPVNSRHRGEVSSCRGRIAPHVAQHAERL